MQSGRRGFTLVELSIVIVIIGLIVAGVTAGQSLVKQAQLRTLLTQADGIKASVNSFRMQYNGLPGDITNASSFWTTGCLAAGGAGASVAAECNGDGNKKILTAAGNTGEMYMAWLQLSKAGLFPGNFFPGAVITGAIVTGAAGNIPAAKYTGAGITMGFDTNQLTGTNIGKNIMVFGSVVAANYAIGAFLTPPQTSVLDTKADDGNAVSGNIYGGANAASGTACNDTSGVYALGTTTIACTIAFVL